MTLYKFGDKTFKSTGDKNKDFEIITDNYPEIDPVQLKNYFDTLDTVARSDQPKSALDEVNETGDSPLSFIQRMTTQFGDNKGRIDYLKKQGLDPVYRDGQLYIRDKDQKLVPADPTWSLKDIPTDIAEFAADAPSMIASGVGEAGGATLGGAVGGIPGAVVGRTVGGGAGSALGEFWRQLVGDELGVYSGEDSGSDLAVAGLAGGIAPVPGMLARGGKTVLKKGGEYGLKKKFAERLFAKGTGLSQELADNPEVIDFLMKEGISGSDDEIIKLATEKLGIHEQQLRQLLAGKQITLDDVLGQMTKYKGRDAAGDIGLKNNATKEVVDEFSNDLGIFKNTTKQIPGDEAKELAIPDDEYLARVYKKQYPKAQVNLPLAPHTETITKELDRPTFEQFKKEVTEQFYSKGETPGKLKTADLVTAGKVDGGGPDEDFIKQMYEESYPATKDVKRTYPLPKGKMTAPSFDEWKQTYVSQLAKQNKGQAVKTVTEKSADGVDLLQAKRDLYKASQKLFNNETYQVTKKQAQKELSLAVKDALENAGGGDVKELSQKLHAFGVLADMLDLKVSGELSKPVIPGTTRVVGSLAGPKGALMDLINQTLLSSTSVNTKAAAPLKALLEKMAGQVTTPTKKTPFINAFIGQSLRETNPNR